MKIGEKKAKKKDNQKNMLSYTDSLEKEKYDSGKKGTAGLYKATRNQLEQFLGKPNLHLKSVNSHLVQGFIDYLHSLALSQNSVSNYTSIFRATYNAAVSENLVNPAENPFRKVYLRPVQTYKRSVGTDVLKDITHLNLKWSLHATCSCSALWPVEWLL